MVKFYTKIVFFFCLSLLFGKHLLAQTGTPISISSGYNYKLIAPNYTLYQSPTAYLDVDGYVFLASDGTSNVPANSTANGYLNEGETFAWKSTSVNNSMQLQANPGSTSSMTVTLTTPARYTKLYFLYTLGKWTASTLGSENVRIQLNYTDNTSSTTLTQSVAPYNTGSLGTTSGSHVKFFSRVQASQTSPTPSIQNSGASYVDELKWDLTSLSTVTKLVKSITFSVTPSSATLLNVFAISGVSFPTSNISGTVRADNFDDGVIAGQATGAAASFISLVGTDNKVIATTGVNSSTGAYTFSNMSYSTDVNKLILTTTDPGVGTTLTQSSLTSLWVDGFVPGDSHMGTKTNAIRTFTRTVGDQSGIDISVHRLPTANDRNVTFSTGDVSTAPTPSGQNPMTVSQSAAYTSVSGKMLDLRGATGINSTQAISTADGSGSTGTMGFYLTAISDGAALYYDNAKVDLNTVYPAPYDKNKLFYQFPASGNGKSFTFQYKAVDKFGFITADPAATYTISLTYALPVTYAKELDATMSGKVVNLTWSTATEINNSRFEVERSTDGNNWNKIASIPSYFADGNGTGHSYSYPDETPFGGTNYYRLKQVDRDGATKISGVAQVSVPLSLETIKIFPNPVIGTLNIRGLPSNASYVAVYSIDGKLLLQKSVTSSNTTVDLYNVPSGMYTLKISDKNGQKIKSSLFSKK